LFQSADDQLFCPTVLEDVAFGPLNQGLSKEEARERALETLESLGLKGYEERPPYRLSGGEKKLVSLATVLSMRPEALLLDEPTNGLDQSTRSHIIDVLNGLNVAILAVSHEPDFLSKTTETILVLRDGRIQPGEAVVHTHAHAHEGGDAHHTHSGSQFEKN
ncbi:MAG: energy-coupling factor ABC transporter ATP-binding protein, partial [Desulfovibrionaceae bacterium]